MVGLFCGSGLARDAGGAFFQMYRIAAIASKPAPTLDLCRSKNRATTQI
jgi:hypothetical protein